MTYDSYSPETREYMLYVESYLIKRYGTLQQEWEANLTLLADDLDLYKECLSMVKTYGIYDAKTGHKNPLLSTMKDLQATISKYTQHLGLSPWSAARIRQVDENDSDLLKNIMGED